MSGYNNMVGKIASKLEDNNMQGHMNELAGNISPKRSKTIKNIVDNEYFSFINGVFETALYTIDDNDNSDALKRVYEQFEDDLIPIFKEIDERCLDDERFSKCLARGELYSKTIGSNRNQVLFYPPGKDNPVKHDVVMKLLYIPSASPNEGNRFRIDVVENLSNISNYPYINFSVDINDDGKIVYNEPVKIELNWGEGRKMTPVDWNSVHVKVSQNIEAVRDVLMDIFTKTGIKVNSDSSHR